MENGITLSRNGQNYGPYDEGQILGMIASGHVSADDHAWKPGMADWKPLRSVIPSCVSIPPPPMAKPVEKKGIGCMAWAAIIFGGLILVEMIHQAFSDANPGPPTATDHYYAATATIRKSLKAPSTAKFSRPDDEKAYYQKVAGNVWEAGGWVDSQNGFGAMIRSDWKLVWDDATKKVLFVRMGGKTLFGNYKEVTEAAKKNEK